jgi:vitamin B12 transporter
MLPKNSTVNSRGVARTEEHNMIFLRMTPMLLTAALFTSVVTATENDPQELETIVITANREPTPIRNVGSAFSVVDRSAIVQRQSTFAAELLQDLPGISVSRTGTFGSQTQVRIRGAEANHVMVMIDGIKANDLASNDEFNFANLTTLDVERIEVVRGPQSALWGSDSTTGVINVITRTTDKPLEMSGFLEAGSFDTFNGGAHVGAAGEKTNFDLSASYLDTEGTNISRNGDEKDGYTNLTTTLKLGYDPLENLQLDFIGRFTDAENEFDDSIFGPPVDANNRTEQSQAYVQARGRLSLFEEFWDQQLRLTWVDTDNQTLIDDALDSTQDGEKLGLYYQSNLNLTRDSDGAVTNNLILALDFEDEKYKQRGTVQPFGDPNRTESLKNLGLVAEYLITPLRPWALSLALRYDDNSDFDNVTTWRATTSYTFDSTNTRLRASAGTGQKRPTFTERFGFFTNFIGNPDLKPEKSHGWDLGIDQGFFADRLTVNLTYFNETLKDEINGFAFDANNGGFTAVNLDDESDRKGVEAALNMNIIGGLDLAASYTYTDSSQPDGSGGSTTELRRPRHMGAVNLNYGFVHDRANLNLNVSYSGDQQDNDFSTFPATPVTLDAYTLVNLTAEFAATENVTVYARVENLFDENYENVFGFASPGIGGFIGTRLKF